MVQPRILCSSVKTATIAAATVNGQGKIKNNRFQEKRSVTCWPRSPKTLISLALGATLLLTACGDKKVSTPEASPSPTTSASSGADNKPKTAVSTAAKTAPGTGNLAGAVRWNSKGAPDLDVKLCQKASSISGCSGKEILGKTDKEGKYLFENTPVGEYALLIRVFDTDSWIFPAEGIAGMQSKKFKVTEGQTLTLTTQNIYKLDLKLKSPEEGGQIDQAKPTLQWETYPEASYYKIYLSAQDNSQPYEPSIVNQKVNSNQFVPEKALTKCNYTWRVQAFNKDGIKIAENDSYAKFSIATCKKQ